MHVLGYNTRKLYDMIHVGSSKREKRVYDLGEIKVGRNSEIRNYSCSGEGLSVESGRSAFSEVWIGCISEVESEILMLNRDNGRI